MQSDDYKICFSWNRPKWSRTSTAHVKMEIYFQDVPQAFEDLNSIAEYNYRKFGAKWRRDWDSIHAVECKSI